MTHTLQDELVRQHCNEGTAAPLTYPEERERERDRDDERRVCDQHNNSIYVVVRPGCHLEIIPREDEMIFKKGSEEGVRSYNFDQEEREYIKGASTP